MQARFGMTAVLVIAWYGGSAGRLAAASPHFFQERIAPILRERCITCHNPSKAKGSLDLTTRQALLEGGDSGPAILPGKAAESPLIKMISGRPPKMPRQGKPLSRAQVADFRQWVDAKAPWPAGVTLTSHGPKPAAGRTWWAFRPLVRPAVPLVKNRPWVRTAIDAFVLAKLEAMGMKPAPPADRATLIRRVTYDLHGLPPTPEEIDGFVNDPDPGAYEKLIDRLLASPRYGERWGRHWLDVVHYGDTHGYDKDKRRDFAWPYRDYVIRSFNGDKPYARFIKEQLAGDVLYPQDPDGITATGFIAAGPWDFVGHVELREGTVEKKKTRVLDRDDMVANTISTFVSMTAHCARCHDHKFDPIPQRDYYRLQAVFAGVDRGDRPRGTRRVVEWKAALERKRQALAMREADLLHQIRAVTSPQTALARVRTDLAAVRRDIRAAGSLDLVYAVLPHAPRPIHVLHRGNVEQPGKSVGPGALSLLPGLPSEFTQPGSNEGDRRAALAAWIADRRNVLTWRSIVNRVWHYHFGRGIVDTPSDFGRNGSRPTHPELLDWLAVEFRDGGQSFKGLHRLILRSSVYRQASRHDPTFARLDADNRFLWRMNRGRLDAESVRDAVLAISGKMDWRMGGPGFELFRFKDDHSPVYDHSAIEKINDPRGWRRAVYRFTVRSVPNPFLECLDCADPNINTPVRNTTLTALQALALLNDPFMIRQAEFFAARLKKQSPDLSRQIEAGWRLALGRRPRADEKELLASYARRHGLVNACRLLFNANEFMFID
jgi:hypothetical protein